MALYDEALAKFVGEFGEQPVVSALNAYRSSKARMEKYAAKYASVRKERSEKRKADNKWAKELAAAAATPEGAAKVRELLAARGINVG